MSVKNSRRAKCKLFALRTEEEKNTVPAH